jgi:NADH-quinone oxidoreductase subunit G
VASAGFVVSLEIRVSAVTELANVVFPVAAAAEKSGAYVNWEGRVRPFAAALPEAGTLDEARILDTLGVEMDVDLYTQTPAAASADIARLGVWSGARPVAERFPPVASDPAATGFRLASWRMNLDGGRGLDGEPHLMGTAKPDVVRLSPAAATGLGVRNGNAVVVRGPASSITLPMAITAMLDDVVWLPAHIDGIATTGRLGVLVGDRVQVQPTAVGRDSR